MASNSDHFVTYKVMMLHFVPGLLAAVGCATAINGTIHAANREASAAAIHGLERSIDRLDRKLDMLIERAIDVGQSRNPDPDLGLIRLAIQDDLTR